QLTPAQLVRLYKQTHHHFPPPPPTPEPTVGEGSGATWMVRDQSPSSLLKDILYTLKKQTSSEAADALEELGREYDDTELDKRAVVNAP
ncbi:MAG: hypothetical protein IPN01_36440, partial [Deltaproteobacteria bacterium]|nr:hypothetical protein [Deltaproteobacteria bacterium]